MTAGRESRVQVPRQQSSQAELLAKVEFFRKELGSIVPSELHNSRSRSLVNCLGLAARDIRMALCRSDNLRAPLNDFESRQKQILLESSGRHVNELQRFRTEMTSLIDSHVAEHNAPVPRTPRKLH
jgi:hypothetical protein